MVVSIPAMTRVETTNEMECTPTTSSASISSLIRIDPISAVIRQPAWTAKAAAASSGANSRVMANDVAAPATAPRSRMLSVPWAMRATVAPAARPSTTISSDVPPPTMTAPRPHARSVTVATVWRRYRKIAAGRYRTAR